MTTKTQIYVYPFYDPTNPTYIDTWEVIQLEIQQEQFYHVLSFASFQGLNAEQQARDFARTFGV